MFPPDFSHVRRVQPRCYAFLGSWQEADTTGNSTMEREDLDLKPTLINGQEEEDIGTGLSRRSFFMAAGAAGVGGAASLLSSTSAQAQSTDWTQPGNNNGVIELQKTTGAAVDGDIGIDFYGHCALKFTSPGGATVLFDPWRDDPSGAWGLWFKNEFPETPVDICMSTHTHFDHDAIHRPVSTMVLDRMVGNSNSRTSRSPGSPTNMSAARRAGTTGPTRWMNSASKPARRTMSATWTWLSTWSKPAACAR